FSQTRGLFGGVSIEGSLMGSRSEWNRAYYGRELGSQQIVIDMQGTNPRADATAVSARFGAAAEPAAAEVTSKAAIIRSCRGGDASRPIAPADHRRSV